jgi:hypothetical protein
MLKRRIGLLLFLVCGLIITMCADSADQQSQQSPLPEVVHITKSELLNKIKGGWAGQTIGVCYGIPTEFKYQQEMVPESVQMKLTGEFIKNRFNNDDLYMDAKFIEVIGRLGLGAHADSFAVAFADAGFNLFHANQAARINILNGIMPPESGHWKYGMHSDDIDFQIEADFAGLTSGGMLDAAISISDKVGHIMNYGDGWYSGVYVAGMYSLAFLTDDVEYIVNEALQLIPKESKYYKAMSDVIGWHKKYPNDWRKTWQTIEDCEWSYDLHCPAGVEKPFNIDATVNMAYVLVGLLYGEGDFVKSTDISMRCGQDSDCNPSSVAGILGTIMGYENIPEEWLTAYKEVEDITLNYTTVSLNDCYDICMKSALENIQKYGGEIDGENITIRYERPNPVPYEEAYPNIFPQGKFEVGKELRELGAVEFEGTGIAFVSQRSGVGLPRGSSESKKYEDYVAEVEVTIDGNKVGIKKLPFKFHARSLEIYYNVDLPKGRHTVEMEWLNPIDNLTIPVSDYIVFSDQLVINR